MTTMTDPGPPQSAPEYPIRLNVTRPESQSRITNFPLYIGTLIRLILLVPHILVLYYLSGAAFLAGFVSLWAILFTGRYPDGLFRLIVGTLRWYEGISIYLGHLIDRYPLLDLDPKPDYPFTLTVDYPQAPSRWLNLPFFPVKFILAIPHFVVLFFLGIVAAVLIFIGTIVILFTGAFPAGLHSFVVGTRRWNVRVAGYLAGFTDKYPPFSLD